MASEIQQRLKSVDSLFGPVGPTVDASNMIFFGSIGGYGPKIEFDFTSSRIVKSEPIVDLLPSSPRWKMFKNGLGRLRVQHAFYSLAFHSAICLFVYSAYLFFAQDILFQEDEVPVEISFGLDIPNNTASSLPGKVGNTQVDQEATKTQQQLPQLPKQLAIDAAIPKADSLPLPIEEKAVVEEVLKKEDELLLKEEESKRGAEIKEKPKPNVKVISAEELAKRVERENRKVDKAEQVGTHAEAGDGRKIRPNDLPSSPFSKEDSDIPQVPAVLPQGSLDGKLNVSAKDQYRTAATNHIKRFWALPELAKFDQGLLTEISVAINSFGRVIGVLRVIKTSGVREFDEMALQAVRDAVPFPELPAPLAPRVTITMKFSPQKIEN